MTHTTPPSPLSPLPSRIPDVHGSRLISPLRRPEHGEGWLADLVVDRRDPFFFDRPVDHVPGMLLVCAMADLVAAGDAVPAAGRVEAAIAFHTTAALGTPTELRADSFEDGRRRAVQVFQPATLIADGWAEFSPAATAPGRTASAPMPVSAPVPVPVPVPVRSAHRGRPENVLIGDPSEPGGVVTAAVLSPPAGHPLGGRRPGTRRTEAIIESGRQLSAWLAHRTTDWPPDARLLPHGLTIDLPYGLPDTLPLALRRRPAPISAHRTEYRYDLITRDGAGSRPLGTLAYTARILRPRTRTGFRANRDVRRDAA
ncbi:MULTISPECIES: hypothetical protein [Kitasatospora]|uniref:A-factor biosynthesis hotdog domain-containing protein n=1 Tax=Kitasatospora setae (strain ATCC 33774 / DSM 43861 / JCM 3304 / KCC A-0304 / NBRC 14216 / KM-6054) TaxID=452652 RepID=E4N2K5_KITSK|nr:MULTISPECIES: hypothetical protein [Kitasatospora]BAJ32389.1 hypothetical protein KSE_66300 [Kitasatospora setae KM-6054]